MVNKKWIKFSDLTSLLDLGAGYTIDKYLKNGKYIYTLQYTLGDEETKQVGTTVHSDSIELNPELEQYQIVFLATGSKVSGLKKLDTMLFTEEFTEGMMKYATEYAIKRGSPDENAVNWLAKYLKALSDRYVEYKQIIEQQKRKI